MRTWICWLSLVAASFWVAYLLRFDFSIPRWEFPLLYSALPLVVLIKGGVFCGLRMQLERWPRYSDFPDLVRLIYANVLASTLSGACIFAVIGRAFPRSIYFLDLLVCILFSGTARFTVRLWHETLASRQRNGEERGLLVYGAGIAGLELAREIRSNPNLGYRVLGFIDDDIRKHGAELLGLPVLGTGEDAAKIVNSMRGNHPPAQEIVVSMPSATGRRIRAAVERGRHAGVPCRIVPGLGELISGKLHVTNDHEISVTDLLGREPVHLDMDKARREFRGQTVLVTGAAGSIGSELCNQLSQVDPGELIALDQAESELFRLEAELRGRYPALNLSAEIADIRNRRRMEEILDRRGVDAIFHAAAYKHVPVMERQACEAARNNVIGTWNLAQAAWRSNVSRFLMISTDKAVNPSSIMGLTKRVAELVVTASRLPIANGTMTKFVCVRFGNVLVSNGSVVPIFRKQIASGGPVTVTHPEMRRYFMTVEEAVQLVLEAVIMGRGSEIFMLDMGNPVRIVELARKMITMAGLKPGEDIEIRVTGVRPGEKLFEELNSDGEDLLPTSHKKIRIFQCRQLRIAELEPWIAELEALLSRSDAKGVICHLSALVPEYRPIADVVSTAAAGQVLRPQAVPAIANTYTG